MRRIVLLPILLAAAGILLVAGLYRQALIRLDAETVENHARLYEHLIETQARRLEGVVSSVSQETQQWGALLADGEEGEAALALIMSMAGDYPVRFLAPDQVFHDPGEHKSFLDGIPLDRFPSLREPLAGLLRDGGIDFLDGIPWQRDPRGLLVAVSIRNAGGPIGVIVREIPWRDLEGRALGSFPVGAGGYYAVLGKDGSVLSPEKEGVSPVTPGAAVVRELARPNPHRDQVGADAGRTLVVSRPVAWSRQASGVTTVRIPVSVEVGINPRTYLVLGTRVAELVNERFPIIPPTREELAASLPALQSASAATLIDVEVAILSGAETDPVLASVLRRGTREARLVERHAPSGGSPISIMEVTAPYFIAGHSWRIGVVQPLEPLLHSVHIGMRQSLLVAMAIVLILLTMAAVLGIHQRDLYRRKVAEAETRGRLEEEVQRAKTQLQAIVDGVDSGIGLVDREGTIRRVNGFLARLLDRSPESLVGAPIGSVLPGWIVEAWRRWLQGGGDAGPVTGPWKEGRTLEGGFYPLTDPEGTEGLTIVTVGEITSRLRLQDRLRVAEKLAATSTLVAGVAHEIKNPLNSMALSLGNLSYLLKKEEDAGLRNQAGEYVGRLKEDIARLTDLVNRFMAVARPIPEERRPVDLAELTRRILDRFANQASDYGIVVAASLAPVPVVPLEPMETERAVENLVLNAIEAMPRGGTLTVATARLRGEVTLEVADTGPGIPEENLGRIFDIFFSTKEGGTGLGLSIVHRAVEGQGGKVEVSSEVGRGSRFTILFPVPGEKDA